MLRHLRRHDIWIPDKLKLYYLKNKKSFQNEIKNIFFFHKCSLLDLKKTSKKYSWRNLKVWHHLYSNWYHMHIVAPLRRLKGSQRNVKKMVTGCILVPQYTINLFFSFLFCIDIVIQHSVVNKKIIIIKRQKPKSAWKCNKEKIRDDIHSRTATTNINATRK